MKHIHENSKRAYHEMKSTLNAREKVVLNVYLFRGAMTDREVKDYLGLEEMNEVRPRITTLLKEKGFLIELAEKVRDYKTGICVRRCRAASIPEFMQFHDRHRQLDFKFA